ncbi:MAG TPA: hypothetical protein VHX37_16370 [Acidobacteriaceae bacterium]|jgi:hypothetical protein|nr:hypothetical protein [Acidobacteriaceae bacterium]
MLSHCANPKCRKPLHYLREGRIFVFDLSSDTPDGSGKRTRRLEHYWLCGACSESLAMEQSESGVVVARRRARVQQFQLTPTAIAS